MKRLNPYTNGNCYFQDTVSVWKDSILTEYRRKFPIGTEIRDKCNYARHCEVIAQTLERM